MGTHYIAMAGMHGYLPNSCDVYDTARDAAESLADLHDLGRNRRRELVRNGYIELNLQRDGNEYAEVSSCDCTEPWVHSEGVTEAEWRREHDMEERNNETA